MKPGLPRIDDEKCHIQTHPQLETGHHALTARSSSLRCVSAAEHQTAEQYSKLAGQNTESISQDAIYHETLAMTSSRYQIFAKLLHQLRPSQRLEPVILSKYVEEYEQM